jgi:glycosyltransferase involved in cell wall biosynthesis
MAPLVSIVIPSYNHREFVAEAVRSVLAQDYPAVELIVIDDGSIDGTSEVLASLGSGFYWESQSNMGQARTLEKGWRMAKGEVLGYLSADDVLMPSAVRESVAELAVHSETVATYCDFNLIDPDSRVIRRVATVDFNYCDMLVNVICPPGPGAFFRRGAYEAAGPWNPTYRQMPDYDFWLRLGLCGSFARIPRVLAGFRVHEASQSYSRTTPERATEPVQIVERILRHPDLPPDLRLKSSLALGNAYLVSAQLHLRAGRLASGGRAVVTALRHAPGAVLSPRALHLLVNATLNRVSHRVLWWLKSFFFGRHLP